MSFEPNVPGLYLSSYSVACPAYCATTSSVFPGLVHDLLLTGYSNLCLIIITGEFAAVRNRWLDGVG